MVQVGVRTFCQGSTHYMRDHGDSRILGRSSVLKLVSSKLQYIFFFMIWILFSTKNILHITIY